MNVIQKIITLSFIIIIASACLVIRPVFTVDNISTHKTNTVRDSGKNKILITGKLKWEIKNGYK